MKRATTILAALFSSLVFAGCASSRGSQGYSESATIVVYANVLDAVNAATEALAENRLASPTVERTDNGAIVRAELSGLAGAIYNTHGGGGAVPVTPPHPGPAARSHKHAELDHHARQT